MKSLEQAFGGGASGRGSTSSSSGGPSETSSSGAAPSSPPCGVSTDALVAYLPLDGDLRFAGAPGLKVTEDSPGGTSFGSGVRGKALLSGATVRVAAGSSIALPSWTLCGWHYVEAPSEDFLAFAFRSSDVLVALGVTGSSSSCSGSGAGRPFVGTESGSCSPASTGTGTETWALTCWSYDAGSAITMTTNGARTSASGGGPLVISSTNNLVMGTSPSGSESGRLDEVSIWSRVLGASEIAKLATRGCAVSQP